jgi:hypothetical protein
VVVADLGHVQRCHVRYVPAPAGAGEASIYAGELRGCQYTADRKDRRSWPQASQFMCASCLTRRARVWDHCHVHGWVRAPLCGRCNTRNWKGWSPEYGRTSPEENVDTSYYMNCPGYQPGYGAWPCSP